MEDTEGFYLERPDFINSVAFWYQTGEPKRFGQLPPFPGRAVPWQEQHFVRAFKHARTTGAAKVRIETTGMFGARPVLGWANAEPGAKLILPFESKTSGRHALRLVAASGAGFGTYAIQVDDKTIVSRADFRSRDAEELDLELGTHTLKAGPHTLTFVAVEAGAGSPGPLAIEKLRILPLPSEATRAEKTHHEAHFIRLGIGRAVYAYRLAYGELPESLETLVKAELMPERYLSDENGKALNSRREGDFIVVESTGPRPWTYRWQGLDARR
jgi:hypothetical protein